MGDAELHGLAIQLVMDFLPTQDVVSVGQVCRKWRQIASDPFVWRFRHAPDMNRRPEWSDRKKFWRVVQFAPFVRKMSVELPETHLGGSWPRFYEQLGNEIAVKARGLRIRYGLEGSVTPPWAHRMLRRLGPHLEFLEVENVGPEDAAVIKDLILGEGPGPRILHTRTWTDELVGVEAWPVGERPALDLLHISLAFAGAELVRVFGRTAERLELEVDAGCAVVTAQPADAAGDARPRYLSPGPFFVSVWQLCDGHIREVALLRTGRHQAEQCAQQMELVRSALPGAVVKCSVCEGVNLCRCG